MSYLKLHPIGSIDYKKLYEAGSPLDRIDDLKKVIFLKEMDDYIRSKNSDVEQVIINLAASHTSMFVVNSDGERASDERPLVRFNVMVIIKKGDRRERGSAGGLEICRVGDDERGSNQNHQLLPRLQMIFYLLLAN